MEDDESAELSGLGRPPQLRLQTTRRDTRKVPGGFDVDAIDDLSPTKKHFDHDQDDTFDSHTRESGCMPTLNKFDLPSLPPGDSSFISVESHGDRDGSDAHMDTVDEEEMQRHLMNIESSVLPAQSPITDHGKPGIDDTFLFDNGSGAQADRQAGEMYTSGRTPADPHKVDYHGQQGDRETGSTPSTLPRTHQTPVARDRPDDATPEDVGDTTSILESMSSSPTAAATARTISRAVSAATLSGYETANDHIHEESRENSDEGQRVGSTPKRKRRQGLLSSKESDGGSTIRRQSSVKSLSDLGFDAGNTPGAALLGRRASGRRPRYLQSRTASQRTSRSSIATDEDIQSVLGLGADYALQSRGAAPMQGLSRTTSYALSRSLSLGSMASGIEESGNAEESRQSDRALTTLDEEKWNDDLRIDRRKLSESPSMATPRANATLPAPTDTVIARHVRDVQVPDSIAREFRSQNRMSSPSKAIAASTQGRGGKNLTLKEQSSTIERLLKENFDLKLKVMFLSDRLDKLSEEGVKETISENVDLKTALANMQRDNKALRKKIRDLEQKALKDGARPTTARSGTSSDDPRWLDSEGSQVREEELIYLRERVEEHVMEIERLRTENLTREVEKRKMAETVRAMSEQRGEDIGTREEMDVWKDLLEQETARREQADEENHKLRDEIFRLKTETGSTLHVADASQSEEAISRDGTSTSHLYLSEQTDLRKGAFSAASTVVDDLRKESERLRHENIELRREVGAQTSMLTSRNREKERLYQEIEDLKLGHRKASGSVAGDSILDRSASRARARPESMTQISLNPSNLADDEREELENKNAELRDRLNDQRLKNQELQQEIDGYVEEFDAVLADKEEAEKQRQAYQQDYETAEADVQTMQGERDEALMGQQEAEDKFEDLHKEAHAQLVDLAERLLVKDEDYDRLQANAANVQEDYDALSSEMKTLGEQMIRLEDEVHNKVRQIQELQLQMQEANQELEELDKKVHESNEKSSRLTVQLESSQGEIAFLREEQDGDKIKIGDFEAVVKNLQLSIQEEQELAKDMEQRLAGERQQREVVAGKEKQEVQKYINSLNREITDAKDEIRRLRKKIASEEAKSSTWNRKFDDLETSIRTILGNVHNMDFNVVEEVQKRERENDRLHHEIEGIRGKLAEKDHLVKQRDGLLESHSLESGKLSDLLEKERQGHRNTRLQFDSFQRAHQHTSRTVTQQEARVGELETSRAQDRKRMTILENSFKEQLLERNNLLLALWNRLATVCGSDWANDNKLVNGKALPTLEVVTNMLPGFSKNLFAAIKNIETLISTFKTQVRAIEKSLWKEYQTLEQNLEQRTKKIDRLESVVRGNMASQPADSAAEITKLKDTVRNLKVDLANARNVDSRTRSLMDNTTGPSSPSPSIPMGPGSKSGKRSSNNNTLTRHQSASVVEQKHHTIERAVSSTGSVPGAPASLNGSANGNDEASEQRWILRLRELERRLKAEREARLLDRHGARKRLEEGERRNQELEAELERNRIRKDTALH